MTVYIIEEERQKYISATKGGRTEVTTTKVNVKSLDDIVRKYYAYVNKTKERKYHYSIVVKSVEGYYKFVMLYKRGKPVVYMYNGEVDEIVCYPITKDHRIGKWRGEY